MDWLKISFTLLKQKTKLPVKRNPLSKSVFTFTRKNVGKNQGGVSDWLQTNRYDII